MWALRELSNSEKTIISSNIENIVHACQKMLGLPMLVLKLIRNLINDK